MKKKIYKIHDKIESPTDRQNFYKILEKEFGGLWTSYWRNWFGNNFRTIPESKQERTLELLEEFKRTRDEMDKKWETLRHSGLDDKLEKWD